MNGTNGRPIVIPIWEYAQMNAQRIIDIEEAIADGKAATIPERRRMEWDVQLMRGWHVANMEELRQYQPVYELESIEFCQATGSFVDPVVDSDEYYMDRLEADYVAGVA